MLKESFKLVCRKLLREKVYTVINIVGMVIALTAALLIYSHVMKEWNMDRFHKNRKQIYRLVEKHKEEQYWSSINCAQVGPYTKAEYPDIKNVVRVNLMNDLKIKWEEKGDYSGKVDCIFADPQFFEMFTFPVLSGNLSSTVGPDWVVISEKMAKSNFPGKNPVGSTLWLKESFREEDKGREYHIVAVMADIPETSTLQADLIADFSYREKSLFDSWGMHGVLTFFQLGNKANIPSMEQHIPEIVEKNYSWIKADEHMMKLQPLEEIYFNSEHIQENLMLHGSKRLTLILVGITVLILLLSSCNYWMIRLACLNRDAAGWAIQHCFGANTNHLKRQLLLETAIQVGSALLLAMGMTIVLHPYFVGIISPGLPYTLHFSIGGIAVFLAFLFFFVFGLTRMLAFYMLKRLEREGIKNTIQRGKKALDMKNVLLVIQICIFSTLLCCSIVLLRQMKFVENRHLGFDREHVINFYWMDRNLNLLTLRSEMMQNPDLLSFSNGYSLPLLGENPEAFNSEEAPQNVVNAYMIHGDAEFLNTYRIGLAEGRNINAKSYPVHADDFFRSRPEVSPEILINKKFAQKLGIKNPVGSVIKYAKEGSSKYFRIVGITEDFHFLPLYQAVQPAYIVYDMPFLSSSMLVRYREGKRKEVLAWLEKRYKEKFINSDFLYNEYDYSQLYDKDITLVKLINCFTLIAILISGMGIFAFSVFMVESRTREVALRKVNGAGEWEIIRLLNQDFLIKVLCACAIGLPIAHYAMSKWLEGFAYKIELDWGIYLLVIVVSVLLMVFITTWQIWQAATSNPVDKLKRE